MLLLWKSVYPYEYMDDWEKFTETLSEKEHLYIRVNKGDITDAIYTPAKRVCKKFEKKCQYHCYTMIYMFKVIRYWLFFYKLDKNTLYTQTLKK